MRGFFSSCARIITSAGRQLYPDQNIEKQKKYLFGLRSRQPPRGVGRGSGFGAGRTVMGLGAVWLKRGATLTGNVDSVESSAQEFCPDCSLIPNHVPLRGLSAFEQTDANSTIMASHPCASNEVDPTNPLALKGLLTAKHDRPGTLPGQDILREELQPPRGPEWKRWSANRKNLFSHSFLEEYPRLAEAAYLLSRQETFNTLLYQRVITDYPPLLTEFRAGKFPASDIVVFHDCCFAGNLPDELLRVIHLTAPELLEDAAEFKDILEMPAFPHGSLSGLHAWDSKTLFRPNVGKRRQAEYGAWPLDKILTASRTRAVVVRANGGFTSWLLGRPIPRYKNETTGVFFTSPGEILHDVVTLDPTYYSYYAYLRRNSVKVRQSKTAAMTLTKINRIYQPSEGHRIGFIAETTGTPGTKYRKFGYGQRARHHETNYRNNACSAIEIEFADAQTTSRARRTDMLKAERANDIHTIDRIVTDPGTIIQCHHALQSICDAASLEQPPHDEIAGLIKITHPYEDQELLARTRVNFEVLARLIPILLTTYGRLYVYHLMLGTTGLGLQGLGGLTLYALSSRTAANFVSWTVSMNLCCHGVKKFSKGLKSLHVITRRTNIYPSCALRYPLPDWAPDPGLLLTQLPEQPRHVVMYVYLLCGRAQDELLGFDKYVEKRSALPAPQHAPVASADPLESTRRWDTLMGEALENLSHYVRDRIVKRRGATPEEEFTPNDLHSHFISLAPRGSVGAGKKDFERYGIPKHNLHKRLWFDAMPTDQMMAVLDRFPEVITNAQVKTEAGLRLRQIIPGEIHQWLIESMAVFDAEDAIFEGQRIFSLGSSGWSRFVDHMERTQRSIRGLWTIAVDFDDFNFLHTLKDMSRFWIETIQRPCLPFAGPGSWGGHNYPGHIVRCTDWLSKSLDRLFVREVGSDGLYRIVHRGLWSGWRTTTLINNCMHYCYDHIIKSTVLDAIGQDAFSCMRINGDDGDMACNMITAGLFLLRHYALAHLDAQSSKQLFSRDSAEFLRIWYQHDSARGSLARSCASFIGGDLQDPVIDKLPDFCAGTSTAVDILIRRGFSPILAETVRDSVCQFYAAVSYTDSLGTTHTCTLQKKDSLYAPYAQGGYGLARHGKEPHIRLATSKAWDSDTRDWDLEPTVPHHGSDAMMGAIYRRFSSKGVKIPNPARLHRAILNLSNQGVDTQLNHVAHNEWRKSVYDHVTWLNSVHCVPCPVANTTKNIPPSARSMATTILDQAMTTPYYELEDWEVPRIYEGYEKLTSAVLGLASIEPGLVGELIDAATNEKIEFDELVRRFSVEWGPDMLPFNAVPSDLRSAILCGKVDLRRVAGNAIPDDWLVLVEFILSRVLTAHPSPFVGHNASMEYYSILARETNIVITERWLEKYRIRYQL